MLGIEPRSFPRAVGALNSVTVPVLVQIMLIGQSANSRQPGMLAVELRADVNMLGEVMAPDLVAMRATEDYLNSDKYKCL